MNEKFLNNLLNSISVSGYEEQVQDIVTEEMKEYTDEIRRDDMYSESGKRCTYHAFGTCR